MPLFSSTNDTIEGVTLPDFPYNKEYQPGGYLSVSQMWQYLKDYVDHFELNSHIQVNWIHIKILTQYEGLQWIFHIYTCICRNRP